MCTASEGQRGRREKRIERIEYRDTPAGEKGPWMAILVPAPGAGSGGWRKWQFCRYDFRKLVM